jgi:hypothetical protein
MTCLASQFLQPFNRIDDFQGVSSKKNSQSPTFRMNFTTIFNVTPINILLLSKRNRARRIAVKDAWNFMDQMKIQVKL